MTEPEVVEMIENKKAKKIWSRAEKLLLPVALLLAILFDRLVITQFIQDLDTFILFYGVFWLCYLAIFYTFYWERVKRDYVLWFVAVCVAALSLWGFIVPWNPEYTLITVFVIPGVLMAHAQWTAGAYTLKDTEGMVVSWFSGWFVKPFSGLPALSGVLGSLVSEDNKPTAKRIFKLVLLGLVLSISLLLIIVPLLMGADQVFNHYITQLFADDGSSFNLFWHSVAVIFLFGWFYSGLWNVGFKKEEPHRIPDNWAIDIIISAIVLGSIALVYILFCFIQFTYLFAGAGLPAGMTYSEYAREGFAQMVVVCTLNLIIFGVFMQFGAGKKLLTALLSLLLALTGVMLISGAVRLNLYIGAYGMTWLRLLSAWFIIYLAAVIILCAVRLLFKKRLPVVAICVLLLLIWYVVLGYLNPDGFIYWYNYDFFLR
ncbi:MAG: DUF4173 domain-containing protein [Defluviitaleaceae bacterium]|nr:DUF4173 domain-containing protein [Defluviitaleaceae bacterium]